MRAPAGIRSKIVGAPSCSVRERQAIQNSAVWVLLCDAYQRKLTRCFALWRYSMRPVQRHLQIGAVSHHERIGQLKTRQAKLHSIERKHTGVLGV